MSKAILYCVTLSEKCDDVIMASQVDRIKASVDCSVTGSRSICIDTIKGTEEGYQYREKCEVRIISNNEEVFSGTFDELVEKVSR